MGTITAITTQEGPARVISYATTKDEIAELAEKYKAIDPAVDFETARLARADLRSRRVAVEARRKDLKAEALEFGRRVDGAAKELTALISAIEDPIDTKIKAIEQAEAHARFQRENAERLAREQAERDRIAAEEAEARAKRAKEDADRKAALDAAAAELAESTRLAGIENDRIMAEQAQREAAQRKEAARLRKEADDLAAERKKLDEEKAEAKRKENARIAAETAAREATERAERELVALAEAEERRKAEEEAARVKAEALKPDKAKLEAFASFVRGVIGDHTPDVLATSEAGEAIDQAVADLEDIAKRLEAFGS